MTLVLILTVGCVKMPFLFQAEYYSIACARHILFVLSSVSGHSGCFYLLAVVNYTAILILKGSSPSFTEDQSKYYLIQNIPENRREKEL